MPEGVADTTTKFFPFRRRWRRAVPTKWHQSQQPKATNVTCVNTWRSCQDQQIRDLKRHLLRPVSPHCSTSSAIRTHGRTPQDQHVCRRSWLRKIRVEQEHESVRPRQHRLHQPIKCLLTDTSVRVAIRLCAFPCGKHAVARDGFKSSSTVPFPSNFHT